MSQDQVVSHRSCPHCQVPLKRYSVSAFSYSDGLGWGVPELQVCFNDECPIYVKGWNTMYDRYGRVGSQRYWYDPDGNQEGTLPVGHKDAMRGDIIEEDAA